MVSNPRHIVISEAQPVPSKRPGTADIVGFGLNQVFIPLGDVLGFLVTESDGNNTSQLVRLVIRDYEYDAYAGSWRVDPHPRFVPDLGRTGRVNVNGFGYAGVFPPNNIGNFNFAPQIFGLNDFRRSQGWRTNDHQQVPSKRTGKADIVGFGLNQVLVMRNGAFQQATGALNDFCYNAGGWRVEKHVRLVGDTTGNGAADLIGFGDAGVFVAESNGNSTFQPARLVMRDYGYDADAGSWRVDLHPRFVADLRKTGRVDIIGFGYAGVLVSKNNGNFNFAPQILTLNDFGYNQGWRTDRHLRFLADVTGDGFLDIVGFGEHHVFVATGKGDGTFNPARPVILNNMTIGSGGWDIAKHPRLLGDVTGDGKPDIVGFGDAGIQVAINKGDGTFHPPKRAVGNAFAYRPWGWCVEKYPRFLADVNGDGRLDIVGFGDNQVYIAISNGDGTFQEHKSVINDFGYSAGGWRVEKHLRFPVDITGDGCADIVGFGENSVWVSYNDGKGNFSSPVKKLTDEFAFRNGEWDISKTVRFVTNLH